MKKFLVILILGLFLSSNAFSANLKCSNKKSGFRSVFLIKPNNIERFDEVGPKGSEEFVRTQLFKIIKKDTYSHKGILKEKGVKHEINIDTYRNEAKIVSTYFISKLADDVFLEEYLCKKLK